MKAEDVGLALGSFLGDRGHIYAAGLSAGVYTKTLKLRKSVLDGLNQAGRKVGVVMGAPAVEALAGGAREAGTGPRSNLNSSLLGFNLALAVLAIGIIWTLSSSQ